ncbi:hypothetical protein CC78DRAFT_568059 [Lojkania enalia]|uniref:Nucleolar 27S pre-rRNA processing Urb2/Npa2 C-terminal domain-containing protein n=1 Tax=Lojkania enalia TaxID=147567 RepID=A0A9P4KE70_9PLEO|nr:hypothetical protein CC78DRAFT_568059 [Didymosphaeria enalia]
MAALSLGSASPLTPTLPRLLAIDKDWADLNEQIRQATHIIGLPDHWDTIQDAKGRSEVNHRLIRARAEWVLHWMLDKLKDQTEAGAQARANQRAWKLLDWMIHVVPTNRCATQLRDAEFLGVLEKTLQENSDKEIISQAQRAKDEEHSKDEESSETMQEGPSPSRKRKRSSSSTSTSPKKRALGLPGPEQLFLTVTLAVRSIVAKSESSEQGEGAIQAENMESALRTESAQAARILKFWLIAIHKRLALSRDLEFPDECLSLSLVQKIWESRITDANDSSEASAEQFSNECLIPTLYLYDILQIPGSNAPALDSNKAVDNAIHFLEKLLSQHLFAPSRTIFFLDASAAAASKNEARESKPKFFVDNLRPLRAQVEQIAEIQDASESVPEIFIPLLRMAPQLLDMAIRFSPSQTRRNKITENPWIQSVFIALAECAGCSLEAPKFVTSKASIDVLENLLAVISVRGVNVNAEILNDLFWFHSGAKFPLNQKRNIQWSLIAALIKVDPDFLISKPRSDSSDDRPEDLTAFLFDLISATSSEDNFWDSQKGERSDRSPIIQHDAWQDTIVQSIVVPIMLAYARSRDLLGFLQRWDEQLRQNVPTIRTPLRDIRRNIWENRKLCIEFSWLFEKFLTETQIVDVFTHHVDRIKSAQGSDVSLSEEAESFQYASSSAVMVRTILESLEHDETIEVLRPHLRSLLQVYVKIVQQDRYRSTVNMETCWMTLCQLLTVVWPIDLHGSPARQETFFQPIIDQARKDVAAGRRHQDEHRINSRTRAAALVFLLTACNHLRTVPRWEESIQGNVHRILKSLSINRLEPDDLSNMLEIFCVEFPQLIEYCDPEQRQKSLLDLISKVSKHVDDELGERVTTAFSQHVFSQSRSGTRDAYCSALLAAMEKAEDTAISRSQRESILNKITNILLSNPRDVDVYLSIMNHLMQLPNATSKVCSEGNTLYNVAQSLHNGNFESLSIMQGFQNLVRSTLHHLLMNKDQTQNKRFLDKFESKLASIFKKSRKCSPLKLAIMRGTVAVQNEDAIVPWDQYLALLDSCLKSETISIDYVLGAFNELPLEYLRGKGDLFISAQRILHAWVESKMNIDNLLGSSEITLTSVLPSHTWVLLYTALSRLSVFPDAAWFTKLSLALLRQVGTAEDNQAILRSAHNALASLSMAEKLGLISPLLQSEANSESFRFLQTVISTLDNNLAEDAEQKTQQLAIIPRICDILTISSNIATFNALLDSIDTILLEKSSLLSQPNIESTIRTLTALTSRSSPALPPISAPQIYTRLCKTTRLVLLLHRSRLGGRYHIFLPLLQGLLSLLFIPNTARGTTHPAWLKYRASADAPITPQHATHYTKLLSLLCSPPLSTLSKSHHRRTTSSKHVLNDPVKAARSYASQFVYPLLASFCRFCLSGRLDGAVRPKLMSGVWEVVSVAGLDKEVLDAMYVGMSSECRDVWRGVWEEWGRANGRGGAGSP